MAKQADKDILETLAHAIFAEEVSTGETGAPQRATTVQRLIREAGYVLPEDFDWQDHLTDD